jgi:hypothetical protein
MKIDGQLKADEIRVGRIIIDYLRQPMELSALAALINSEDGQAQAWTKAEGAWSDKTREALNALREAMEEDISRALFGGSSTDETRAGSEGLKLGAGLGEWLDEKGDAPSI